MNEDITVFTKAVKNQFDEMSKRALYRVDIDKQELWELYLKSFPAGTDPVYKTRTEHDCNCCKNFIRDVGNVVAIVDGKIQTIWDTEIPTFYGEISKVMSERVKQGKIVDVFSHRESKAGAATTLQKLEKGVKSWNHFFCTIPKSYVNVSPDKMNEMRTTVQVFERGLNEITDEALSIVLELIEQGSLYRGDEFKAGVAQFKTFKKKFASLNEEQKSVFLWENYATHGARIKNTVIGTLLEDLSSDKEIDIAVRSFEQKVAPSNYKRPVALVTKGMIAQAMKTIEELGIEESLYRRFGTPEDLSVNNVLFADRSTSAVMKGGLKSMLMDSVKDTGEYSRVEEIHIDDFIKNVLPTVQEMEVKFENRHVNNLMSLIAPKNPDSPKILKWNNNFSWSYNGNVTDSIKERVKNAGGNVTGVLRLSLSWYNFDDLDLHVVEPKGNHIHFRNKSNPVTSGQLDVDMNAGGRNSRTPVENITWTSKAKMQKGKYHLYVNNFCRREDSAPGFVVETECDGVVTTYSYSAAVRNNENITVITFHWDGEKMTDIEVGKNITNTAAPQEVWGISTEKFHKVKILTISPNHWDGQAIGNKHYFFIMEKCLNDTPPRGIYNEFLTGELEKHRKVFEMIGEKTRCEVSDNQLSGIGMSSTQRNSLLCRLKGNFDRVVNIKF
jgi:hypothetical protein